MSFTDKLKLALLSAATIINVVKNFNENMQIIEDYVTALTMAASAKTPNAMTLSTTAKRLVFTEMTKTGYVFSLSSGNLKVSESGFIKVDAHMVIYNLTVGDQVVMDVEKNGATFYQYDRTEAARSEVTLDNTTILIPVAAGDYVGISARNNNGARGTLNAEATHITAEFYKDLNFSS